jgi:REP element-mobilizing transposase RayT
MFFITFTTYGTWLHGSQKGSVDREHNAFATPFLEEDTQREHQENQLLDQPPYVMSDLERDIVCQAIITLCSERGWHLLAAHVRSNHVHVVLSADRDPGRVLSDIKARASRDLTNAGFDTAQRNRWTRHGSTRYLFTDDQVDAKIRYTLDEQGERMAWYSEPRTQ